jgi:LPS-assembly lipoprotein
LLYLNLILICGLVFLPGCGFEPLYGRQDGAVIKELADTKVKIISERSGQQLRNLLLTKLTPYGQPDHPRYELSIKLTYTKYELGIQKDATASRAQIKAVADFTLIRSKDRQEICKGEAQGIADFTIMTEAAFSTLSAENNAREVVLMDIADSIRRRLAGCLVLTKDAN